MFQTFNIHLTHVLNHNLGFIGGTFVSWTICIIVRVGLSFYVDCWASDGDKRTSRVGLFVVQIVEYVGLYELILIIIQY